MSRGSRSRMFDSLALGAAEVTLQALLAALLALLGWFNVNAHQPAPVRHAAPHRASRGVERTHAAAAPTTVPAASTTDGQTALVSWYGSGARTANGERFNPDGLTFAHRSMRFGTLVRFCHGGRCVVARCSDRGPFIGGRTFDLSRGAFSAIAPLSAGVATVTWELV